jgi:hypothetical protein
MRVYAESITCMEIKDAELCNKRLDSAHMLLQQAVTSVVFASPEQRTLGALKAWRTVRMCSHRVVLMGSLGTGRW